MDRDCCTGVVSQWWYAWLSFLVRFYMDFIGSLESLGWSIRGRSEFCPLGLSRGLFSIFELRNWQFSWFHRFWFVVFWGMSGGVWYWIWSLLYGGTLTYE